jgi:hypothetical protein
MDQITTVGLLELFAKNGFSKFIIYKAKSVPAAQCNSTYVMSPANAFAQLKSKLTNLPTEAEYTYHFSSKHIEAGNYEASGVFLHDEIHTLPSYIDFLKSVNNQPDKPKAAMSEAISLNEFLKLNNELTEHKMQVHTLQLEVKMLKQELDRPRFMDTVKQIVQEQPGVIANVIGAITGRIAKPIAGVEFVPEQEYDSSDPAAILHQNLALWKSVDPDFHLRIAWLTNFAVHQPEQYKAVINMQRIGPQIP